MTLTREDTYGLLTDERNRGVHINAGVLSDIATALLAAWDERDALQKAQTYSYIGRDGKTVLARDLEDRALDAEAKLAERDAENARLRAEYITDDQILGWIVCMADWDAGGAAAIDEMYDILEVRAALNKEPKP
jgi:hypothetical protein